MSSYADVPHVECRKAHSSAGVLEVLGESYGTSLTCALLMSFQMMMVFTMMTSKLKRLDNAQLFLVETELTARLTSFLKQFSNIQGLMV